MSRRFRREPPHPVKVGRPASAQADVLESLRTPSPRDTSTWTAFELAEDTGRNRRSIYAVLDNLRRKGLAERTGAFTRRAPGVGGKARALWHAIDTDNTDNTDNTEQPTEPESP